MALTYSLKYKKLTLFNRVILEKEGEVIIDRQSFRLKGKGAQDQGETIYFGDMKDLMIKDDCLSFTTFSKDKYVLTNFSNLFDSFLKDFLRVRNDYLADSLFMKVGMLISEYDCSVEIVNTRGKIVPKGKSRIQLYEGSIVIIPETRECMVVYLNFLKNHEFDEDDYLLRLFIDNGQIINISKLGTAFEEVQETMESLLGKMYERSINSLAEVMPEFNAGTLLKLVYKLKEGRLVPFSSLKKIHEDMPAKVETLLFENNPGMKEKINFLRKKGKDENFFFSFSFLRKLNGGDAILKSWFLCALPEQNIIAIGSTSDPNNNTVHFFRIIMQQGDALDKLPAKVLEIDQSMIIFKFDLSPIIKDRKELRKSKYRTVLKRLSFLRLLRKSYMGASSANDLAKFDEDLVALYLKAKEPIFTQRPFIPSAKPISTK